MNNTKGSNLIMQTACFSVSCFFLLWFCAWVIRFSIPREIFAILIAVVYIGAEIYVAYLVLRRLWRWSGKATRQGFKDQAAVAVPIAAEQRATLTGLSVKRSQIIDGQL